MTSEIEASSYVSLDKAESARNQPDAWSKLGGDSNRRAMRKKLNPKWNARSQGGAVTVIVMVLACRIGVACAEENGRAESDIDIGMLKDGKITSVRASAQ